MRRSAFMFVLAGLVGALVATPIAVYAAQNFIDVPSANTFHDDIAWLAETGITKGCNPPANDEFCPEEYVTRGQMAAFMHRFAKTGLGFDPGRLYAKWYREFTEESSVIMARCDEGDVLLSGGTLLDPSDFQPRDVAYDDGPFPIPDDLWTRPGPYPNIGPTFRVDEPFTAWRAVQQEDVTGDWAVVAYCYDVS